MSFRSLHSFINDRVVSQSAQLAHNHNTTSGEYRRLGEHREAIMANGEEEEEESDEGKRVSGLLYKWVNYARGWRPRWFVLEEGVLSYYKMHGPHNLLLTPGADSKVIGQESLRRIATHLDCTSRHPQPLGQFHLMVCSFRENKSDQRRFCVYTGTKKKKKLHLKAENKEDRATWVEALQDAKDNSNMFPPPPPPPPPSTRKVMVPADSSGVPTDRLRQRLLEEGVGETAIRDSENIMRTELSHVLNHNHSFLLETTEKVDLEHEHVKSNKHSMDDVGYYLAKRQNRTDGSASDHEAFFDACDILSTCSDSSTRSHHHGRPHLSSEHEETTTNGKYDAKLPHGSVGSNYPPVRRRKKLPDPTEKETRASLWSLIKDNIGKDLTRVCLPVYFNEPISSLQKCFEDMEYSYLLDQAYTWGKMGNSLMRMLHVAAFAVSGYACTEGRSCKPFNPLLGETYEAEYPEKGIRFISEKVSQHPMILACHCEGRGWTLWGDSNLKSKFWGRSIHLDPVGVLTLKFDDGEVFQWSKVTTAIYNLIFGKLYCDHYGTMRIHGNREYSCKLKFKEQSIIDRIPHQVHGLVEDNRGKTVATIYGKWDERLQYEIFEKSEKGEMCNKSSEAQTIWKQSDPVPLEYQTRYNLTEFAITLNEITPGLREKLAPTDSRLRPDQRCLENGEYEKSNAEKLRLEQRQRQARKMQENGWKPRWFALDKSSNTYCYVGGYWEAREKGNWESCHDIFGQLPTDTNLDQTH